jgi:hypothetical protein
MRVERLLPERFFAGHPPVPASSSQTMSVKFQGSASALSSRCIRRNLAPDHLRGLETMEGRESNTGEASLVRRVVFRAFLCMFGCGYLVQLSATKAKAEERNSFMLYGLCHYCYTTLCNLPENGLKIR